MSYTVRDRSFAFKLSTGNPSVTDHITKLDSSPKWCQMAAQRLQEYKHRPNVSETYILIATKQLAITA